MLQLKGMFRMADLDGSGSIDFNEFLHVCAELSPCLCSDLACPAPPPPLPSPFQPSLSPPQAQRRVRRSWGVAKSAALISLASATASAARRDA